MSPVHNFKHENVYHCNKTTLAQMNKRSKKVPLRIHIVDENSSGSEIDGNFVREDEMFLEWFDNEGKLKPEFKNKLDAELRRSCNRTIPERVFKRPTPSPEIDESARRPRDRHGDSHHREERHGHDKERAHHKHGHGHGQEHGHGHEREHEHGHRRHRHRHHRRHGRSREGERDTNKPANARGVPETEVEDHFPSQPDQHEQEVDDEETRCACIALLKRQSQIYSWARIPSTLKEWSTPQIRRLVDRNRVHSKNLEYTQYAKAAYMLISLGITTFTHSKWGVDPNNYWNALRDKHSELEMICYELTIQFVGTGTSSPMCRLMVFTVFQFIMFIGSAIASKFGVRMEDFWMFFDSMKVNDDVAVGYQAMNTHAGPKKTHPPFRPTNVAAFPQAPVPASAMDNGFSLSGAMGTTPRPASIPPTEPPPTDPVVPDSCNVIAK